MVLTRSAMVCSSCGDQKLQCEFYKRGKVCKACKRKSGLKYYYNNRVSCLRQNRQYQIENRAKLRIKKRSYFRKYTKHRYNTDSEYRLKRVLSSRLHSALKGKQKSEATLVLLGCTLKELKVYLEDQFVEGMSWENYGEWEVDHIMPCASFDLTDEVQQQRCFHYSNLQPLFAVENRQKSAKITYSRLWDGDKWTPDYSVRQ